MKFWAFFIKGIIYRDLNTNSNFRKCFKILQTEINPEKNTGDYTYTKQATGKISLILAKGIFLKQLNTVYTQRIFLGAV